LFLYFLTTERKGPRAGDCLLELALGSSAQAAAVGSSGEQCAVTFASCSYLTLTLTDVRSESQKEILEMAR